MSIGDMFDAAFKLYRQHFLTFVGIVALLQIPMAIAQFVVQISFGNAALENWLRFSTRAPRLAPGQNPFDLMPFNDILTIIAIGLITSAIQYLLVNSLISGALASAIARSYAGQPVAILESYRFGFRRFFALVGASLLTFALGALLFGLVFGGSFGGIVLLLANGNRANGVLAGVLIFFLMLALFVLLGIGALYIYTRLLVTTQAIVLEDRGPLAGMARSWRLVRGAFWRTLAIMVLMGILVYIIAAIPTAITSFALTLTSGNALSNLVRNQIITTLMAQIGQILVLPLQLAIYTLLYYDLRVRKEGYDLELMARQAARV